MFKAFRKKAAEVGIMQPTTEQLIEQIHGEFFTASDRALAEANRIINDNTYLKEKAEKLKACGFTAVPEIQKVRDVEMSRELAERIQYYQQHYPDNKFITHEQIMEICKKYDLIYGPVSRFIGFVPAAKLEQIAAFKLRPEDTPELEVVNTNGELVGYASYASILNPYLLKRCKEGKDEGYVEYSGGEVNLMGGEAKWGRHAKFRRFAPSLMICAPEKDFNTKGMQVRDRKLLNIPDPVVIHPVPEGGLILAAWGAEASDPIVVNGGHN